MKRMKTTRRMLPILAVLLLIAVGGSGAVLAACGGDETTSDDATGGAPIKIGAPLPITGSYALDGQHMQTGMQMAIDDLNAQGGVLGRQLELVTFDIGELLAEDINASAEYLLGKEKVDLVVEGYADYGTDFLAYGARSDVPFINGTASSKAAELAAEDPEAYWNMFDVFPVEADWGRRAWDGVAKFESDYQIPAKRIAIIHGDLEWDLKYTASIAEAAEAAGWTVVLNETVPYGTTDWGPVLTKLRAAEPTAVSCSILSVKDISAFVNQFMEDPPPATLDISSMIVLKDVQDACGDNLIGVMGYVTSYLPPSETNDDFKTRYKEKFGYDLPLTTPPSTYDSVMIWAQAVEAVGDVSDHKAIADKIRATPYQGLGGLYDFNNPGQTVLYGPDFPIGYAQYAGNNELLFFGVDEFFLPPWIQPPWPKAE